MAKVLKFTAVAKKVIMALSGLLLCAFLVAHLAGNAQLYWNMSQFNAYAHLLTVSEAPLAIAFELSLLGIFLIHIVDAVVLVTGNNAARPVGYQKRAWAKNKSNRSRKSLSSTLMMWSGIFILFFVIFHVWHFKFKNPVYASSAPPTMRTGEASGVTLGVTGAANVTPSEGEAAHEESYDLALLVYNEFQHPLVVLIYVAAMIVLGLHLYHAVSSALTTVGANTPRFTKPIIWFGRIFTVVIFLGFTAIPILMAFKILKPENAEKPVALMEAPAARPE